MTPNDELLFELDRLLAELERRLREYAETGLEPTVADEGLTLGVKVRRRLWRADDVARRLIHGRTGQVPG